jgi:hypothetical protein
MLYLLLLLHCFHWDQNNIIIYHLCPDLLAPLRHCTAYLSSNGFGEAKGSAGRSQLCSDLQVSGDTLYLILNVYVMQFKKQKRVIEPKEPGKKSTTRESTKKLWDWWSRRCVVGPVKDNVYLEADSGCHMVVRGLVPHPPPHVHQLKLHSVLVPVQ